MFHGRLYACRLFAGRLYHQSAAQVPQPALLYSGSGGGYRFPRCDARRARNGDDELLLLMLL